MNMFKSLTPINARRMSEIGQSVLRNIDLTSEGKYDSALFGLVMSTEDHLEGIKAYFEKRKPKFK